MKLLYRSLNIFIIVTIICLIVRIGNCSNDIIHEDEYNEPHENHKKINQNLNKDNEKIKNPKMFNFASQAAGAVVLDKSPVSAKGFYNLLNDDKDKYGISSCDEKKWVVIGLSEDILVTSVELANYEKYSSMLKDFQVLASNSYPTNEWYDLGTYTAQPHLGSQLFEIIHNSDAHTRYLKFKFLTHYLDEALCTLSQIKVYGMTVIASFKQEVERSDHQMRDMLNNLNSELDLDYSQILKEELLNIEINNMEPQLTNIDNTLLNHTIDNVEAYIDMSNNTIEPIKGVSDIVDHSSINSSSDINRSNDDIVMKSNDEYHANEKLIDDNNGIVNSEPALDLLNTTVLVDHMEIQDNPPLIIHAVEMSQSEDSHQLIDENNTIEQVNLTDPIVLSNNSTETLLSAEGLSVIIVTTDIVAADDTSMNERGDNFTGTNNDEQVKLLMKEDNAAAGDSSSFEVESERIHNEAHIVTTAIDHQSDILLLIEGTKEAMGNMSSMDDDNKTLNQYIHDVINTTTIPIISNASSSSLNPETIELSFNNSASTTDLILTATSVNSENSHNLSDLTVPHTVSTEDNSPLTQLKKLLPFQLFTSTVSSNSNPNHAINVTHHHHQYTNNTSTDNELHSNTTQSIHSEASIENVTEPYADLYSHLDSNLSHITTTAAHVTINDSNSKINEITDGTVDDTSSSNTSIATNFTTKVVNITGSKLTPAISMNNSISSIDPILQQGVTTSHGMIGVIRNHLDDTIIIQKNILIGQKGISLSPISPGIAITRNQSSSTVNVNTTTIHIVNANTTTISNLSATFSINCFENLSFLEFQKKMIGKLQQLSNSSTSSNSATDSLSTASDNSSMIHNNPGLLSGVGHKDHNVFRSLMQKIKTLEMNHAIVEMYIVQMSECYKLSTREMQQKLSLYMSHQNEENPQIIKSKTYDPKLSTLNALLGCIKHILLRPTDIASHSYIVDMMSILKLLVEENLIVIVVSSLCLLMVLLILVCIILFYVFFKLM